MIEHIQFVILTINIVGEVLIAYTVIRVHHRVIKEHKIDNEVLKVMKAEQIIAVFGLALVVISYFAEVILNYFFI
jgi:hypothetical protein